MAKAMYVGVSDKARKVKKAYVGVDNVARKIKKAYVGIANVARLFFSGEPIFYTVETAGHLSGGGTEKPGDRVGDHAIYLSYDWDPDTGNASQCAAAYSKELVYTELDPPQSGSFTPNGDYLNAAYTHFGKTKNHVYISSGANSNMNHSSPYATFSSAYDANLTRTSFGALAVYGPGGLDAAYTSHTTTKSVKASESAYDRTVSVVDANLVTSTTANLTKNRNYGKGYGNVGQYALFIGGSSNASGSWEYMGESSAYSENLVQQSLGIIGADGSATTYLYPLGSKTFIYSGERVFLIDANLVVTEITAPESFGSYQIPTGEGTNAKLFCLDSDEAGYFSTDGVYVALDIEQSGALAVKSALSRSVLGIPFSNFGILPSRNENCVVVAKFPD